MWRYIVKRLLMTIFVLIGAAVLIFTILYFVPGDPAVAILGDQSTQAEREALRQSLGLNDGYIIRLGRFLYQTFIQFDFGSSYMTGVPVLKELLTRLPRTLVIGWGCVFLNAAIGIPLGIVAALHQNKWPDFLCMFISFIGVSIPTFWFALLLVILFSLKLRLLPAFGIGGIEYYILPLMAHSFQGIGVNARQTRSSMLENIRSDFVTTAKAKGVSNGAITFKHILPNALIPIVTLMGNGLAGSVAGTVVIENVFSFPGVGLYLTTAISTRDYPVVQGCVIFLAAFAAIVQVLVDIVYAYVDPRIKAQYIRQGKGAKL